MYRDPKKANSVSRAAANITLTASGAKIQDFGTANRRPGVPTTWRISTRTKIWIVHRLLIGLTLIACAYARVVRLEVEHRETSGGYEQLTGHFYGELDPVSAANAIITDIRLAARNAGGQVEYTATFSLLRPIDASKGSGVLWYEVPNRGNGSVNLRANSDAMAAGHIVLSSGWQGDLVPRDGLETIAVPMARNADGSPIIGPVIARLSNLPAHSTTALLTGGYGGLHYQRPATADTTKAVLTRQYSDDGALTPIASTEWAFANCEKTPFPGEPDPSRICLKGGFDPDQLYQVVFTAKDPLVLGTGFAATRDLISFLRYSDAAGNPVRGLVKHAIAVGSSQSGNFLRTFVHLGFNQDEGKRIVWDGINPNIAARQLAMNIRFGIPGGAAEIYQPGSEAVLWWGDYSDEARGRGTGGLLDCCRASKTCPKVVETFGASEIWGLRMSPDLVGTKADRDIPLPPEVRRYYFPGVTHGGGHGGFSTTVSAGRGACALPDNPNPSSDTLRALRRALTDWVTKGAAPPESRYPTLAAGQLVKPDHRVMGFPMIPGAPLPDNVVHKLPDYDFGGDFHYADMSGVIGRQPPAIRGYIPMLVPKTDTDGNEVGGVPSVLFQAPLGTYLGWNITAAGYLKGRTCGFAGGFIPFAKTKGERLAAGDPRPSIQERYGTHEAYVAKVKATAQRLVEQRFLLPEDAARLVREAEASDVLR